MNRPRPGRILVLTAGLALATGRAPIAQPTVEAPFPEGPSPSELYRDVKALRLVSRLELTPAQIGKVLPVVQQVADQAASDEAADGAAWQAAKAASERVLAALLAGVDPPPRDVALLDQAAAERNQREDYRAALVADAAARIQRILTAEQSQRIETAAREAQRNAARARLEGADSAAEYIVHQLDRQAELMPDEYLRTREDRAVQMAAAILGDNALGIQPLAAALLNIMNQVAGWTPQQYADQRPTLADQIAQTLNLPEQTDAGLIHYDDFTAWIASDRTPQALKELLAAQQPAAAEEVNP
jgi:hypothetical protein